MRVIAFDDILWNGRDIGDNSCFYKPATVVSTYLDHDKLLRVDIKFDHRDYISRGHFVSSLRRIDERSS